MKDKKLHISGGMMVFIGALLWSLNSPLVKFLTLDALLVCGLRSVIAGIALAPFIRKKQLNWSPWMPVYVVSYAMVCLTVIVSLKLTSAPIAIGMQYTSIIWLFLVNFLKTKRFHLRGFIPVCVIFTGVILFMCSGTDNASNTGNLIALSSGVFFALMTVSSKKAAGTNPIGLTAVANIFTAIAMILIFPTTVLNVSVLSERDWIIMLILGIVQVGGGYGFYNMGVQKVSAGKASILALWEMILGPVWVALFLKEYPSTMVIIGFVIVIIGIILDAKLGEKPKVNES